MLTYLYYFLLTFSPALITLIACGSVGAPLVYVSIGVLLGYGVIIFAGVTAGWVHADDPLWFFKCLYVKIPRYFTREERHQDSK